jgi:hypothetical protein
MLHFLQGGDRHLPCCAKDAPRPDTFLYACIAADTNEVVLLTFSKQAIKAEKLPMLSEPVDSLYLDERTLSLMIVLKESLAMQQFNTRTG